MSVNRMVEARRFVGLLHHRRSRGGLVRPQSQVRSIAGISLSLDSGNKCSPPNKDRMFLPLLRLSDGTQS